MKKVNTKKPLLKESLKPKKRDIKRKKQRTAGIIYNTSLRQRRYINAFLNYSLDLPTPEEA